MQVRLFGGFWDHFVTSKLYAFLTAYDIEDGNLTYFPVNKKIFIALTFSFKNRGSLKHGSETFMKFFKGFCLRLGCMFQALFLQFQYYNNLTTQMK